jgi:hypothetical protein
MYIKIRHEINNVTGLITIITVRLQFSFMVSQICAPMAILKNSVDSFTEVFLGILHIHIFSTSF